MLSFRASAFQHGVTKDQMEEVLVNQWGMTRWFKIHDDHNGNSQDMAIGFDAEGVLIEVGITYVDNDEFIFHADEATTTWERRFNKGL